MLTWKAPEGCPTAEEVIERYQALLTTAPSGEGVMHAEAEIALAEDGTWHLELVTRMGDVTDVRKLRAAQCSDLGEASAVLFAVALEPTLEPDQPKVETLPDDAEIDWSGFVDLEPEAQGSDAEAEVSVVESPAATEPVERDPQRRPMFLSITGGLESGAVPGVTARTSIGTGYAWDWARVEGDLVWYAPRDRNGDFGPATIQVAAATARGCGVPGTGRWKFPVCLGFEAGATIARESSANGRSTKVGRWFAPLLRAGVVVQGRRIGGLLAVEGAGPAFSRVTRVDDSHNFEPNRGSIRGILGMEIYFF